MISLICEIKIIKQTNEYNNNKKKKLTHRAGEHTSGYQWGEGSGKGMIEVGG